MSVKLLNNRIGPEQAQTLAATLTAHATLKSLCGNEGDEPTLDMGNLELCADGTIMLAPEIVANGALTQLNVRINLLGGYRNVHGCWTSDLAGVRALAAAIPACK